MSDRRILFAAAGLAALLWGTGPAMAQQVTANTYGQPGLIDMPQAYVYPDGEIVLTSSHVVNQTRNTFAFQIAPRLTGAFTYALLYDVRRPNAPIVTDYIFDRSFSLRYQIAREGRIAPAIAVGLNDFLGTGIYSGEYVVASKRFLDDRLTATAGLGWGRLAGVGSFDNPLGVLGDRFETRGARTGDQGGTVEFGRWFTGPAAAFAGLSYAIDDRWTVMAEYSPDAYDIESPSAFVRRTPYNLGLRYRFNDSFTLGAQYLYGSEVGVQLSYAVNPLRPPARAIAETAPPLVGTGRAAGAADATGPALAREGITLVGLRTTGATARVEIRNDRYMAGAQAIGRTARVLSRSLPAAVDTFAIVLVENGLPVTEATLTRATLEQGEFALDGAWETRARTRLRDAAGTPLVANAGAWPARAVTVDPYLAPSFFDPDAPLRADLGLDLGAVYAPAPGIALRGNLRQRIIGNLGESERESDSVLPRVRSDAYLYDRAATALTTLTASYAFRPGPDLYARVTAGYLERMFGGVAAEVLWYPTGSRLAFGAEIAHVAQRDVDQRLGFRDYRVTTGHVSAYYDFGGGYEGQLDVGRYLAGDIGATVSLDRTFENGWRVGAFATLTDVPFADFGEGSFDKGIRITIPLSFAGAQPGRGVSSFTLRPLLRDGGARLDLADRLHDTVQEANGAELADSWGRFWK